MENKVIVSEYSHPKKRKQHGGDTSPNHPKPLDFLLSNLSPSLAPVENSPKKRSKSTKLLKPPCSTFSIFGALCCTSACHLNQPSHSDLAARLLTSSYVLAEQNHWASPFLFKKTWDFCWKFLIPKTARILRSPNPSFYSKKTFWLTPSLVPDLPLDLKDTHQHPSQKMLSPSVSHHACCGGNHTRPPKKTTFWTKQQQLFTSHWLSTKEFRKKKLQAFKIAFFLHNFCQKKSFVSRKTSKEGGAKLKNWISSLQVIWRKFLCFHFVKLFSSGVFLVVWHCFCSQHFSKAQRSLPFDASLQHCPWPRF